MKEQIKVLAEVHMRAVMAWTGNSRKWPQRGELSREILLKVEKERENYDKVVPIEGDFWEPEWNPEGATFSWESVCRQIGSQDKVDFVDLAGAQTGLCVQKTYEELLRRGYKVRIREDLTMDLDTDL